MNEGTSIEQSETSTQVLVTDGLFIVRELAVLLRNLEKIEKLKDPSVPRRAWGMALVEVISFLDKVDPLDDGRRRGSLSRLMEALASVEAGSQVPEFAPTRAHNRYPDRLADRHLRMYALLTVDELVTKGGMQKKTAERDVGRLMHEHGFRVGKSRPGQTPFADTVAEWRYNLARKNGEDSDRSIYEHLKKLHAANVAEMPSPSTPQQRYDLRESIFRALKHELVGQGYTRRKTPPSD